MPGNGSQCTVDGQTHYQRNREHYIKRAADRKKDLKEFLRRLKEQGGCVDCGITDWRVLDFDHLPGHDKVADLSKAVGRGWSKDRLLTEVAKCEIVCANCHRIRTHERLASVA